MLVVALVVTFGTASVLQGVAVARANGASSDEPFVTTIIAKPAVKPASAKERMTSRDYIRSSTGVSGL
jgi:hypothetical protein